MSPLSVLASPVAEAPPPREYAIHYRETADGGLEKLPDPAPPEPSANIEP